jgi:hypothetical protein
MAMEKTSFHLLKTFSIVAWVASILIYLPWRLFNIEYLDRLFRHNYPYGNVNGLEAAVFLGISTSVFALISMIVSRDKASVVSALQMVGVFLLILLIDIIVS